MPSLGKENHPLELRAEEARRDAGLRGCGTSIQAQKQAESAIRVDQLAPAWAASISSSLNWIDMGQSGGSGA